MAKISSDLIDVKPNFIDSIIEKIEERKSSKTSRKISDEDKYYTTEEVAKIIRRNKHTVRRYFRNFSEGIEPQIECVKIGKSWMASKTAINKFLKK